MKTKEINGMKEIIYLTAMVFVPVQFDALKRKLPDYHP